VAEAIRPLKVQAESILKCRRLTFILKYCASYTGKDQYIKQDSIAIAQ